VEIFSVTAGPLGSLAMTASFGSESGMVAELGEGISVRPGDEPNRATPAPVAAIRPASRNELFAAEAERTPTTVACPYLDAGFVDELRLHVSLRCR
jgi:hypothetical protein